MKPYAKKEILSVKKSHLNYYSRISGHYYFITPKLSFAQ